MRSQMHRTIDALDIARSISHLNVSSPIIPATSFGPSLAKWLRGRCFGGMLMADQSDSDWPSRYPPHNSQNHEMHGRSRTDLG